MKTTLETDRKKEQDFQIVYYCDKTRQNRTDRDRELCNEAKRGDLTSKLKLSLSNANKEDIKEYSKYVKEKKEIVEKIKSDKALLKTYKSDLIYMVQINYTPIFIDLNNIKIPLSEETINCLNPKLTKGQRSMYRTYGNEEEGKSMVNFLLGDKVCKKHAKF